MIETTVPEGPLRVMMEPGGSIAITCFCCDNDVGSLELKGGFRELATLNERRIFEMIEKHKIESPSCFEDIDPGENDFGFGLAFYQGIGWKKEEIVQGAGTQMKCPNCTWIGPQSKYSDHHKASHSLLTTPAPYIGRRF